MAVVPNGVPLPEPLPTAVRDRIRERFGCASATPLLLAAGRHTAQKNFACLIEAAALLAARGLDFRLVIAGEGELRPDHIAAVEAGGLGDRVVLPGNLPDLGPVMQAADLFILPSLWEGLPLVLLEAMAAGCTVVGTDIAGIAEVLRDGETGSVVPAGEAAPLADAVAELVSDPGRRAALAAAARLHVERDFSFARVASDLGAIYHRVARGAEGPIPRGTP